MGRIPPNKEGDGTDGKSRVDDIDRIQHLGAPWAGQCLTECEELFVLHHS